MDEAVRVLVVEDEESFIDALEVGLRREGFEVAVARDGREAIEAFEEVTPDIVLLDVMLPVISGLDVCRAIRERSDIPVIMVTARSSEVDTVVGLEIGADDYIAKPYRMRELVARMRAVLRRRGTGGTGADAEESGALKIGDISLDPESYEVFVDGELVALPRKEFELLQVLMENPGRVMERHVLIRRVWGSDYVGDTKTLDVHVKRLRTKVEVDPAHPNRLLTVRGVGYKFARS
jgi:two-component system response regulator RegX3